MKKKIQSVGKKAWAVAFLFPLVASAASSGWSLSNPGNLPQGAISEIIKAVMNWLLGILGFVAIIGFIISGLMFLISAGDEDRQKTAKKAMYYSITGIIVGLVGFIVVQAVSTLLGGSSTGTGL